MAVNLTTIKGRRLGLSPNNDLVSEGRIIVPGPRNPAASVVLYDDFLGDLLEDAWSGAKGSDAQGVVPTVVAGAAGGVCRLTSGDTGGTVSADACVLTHGLNWRASNGGLVLETKATLSAITTIAVFIGFTDVLATTTLELPINSAGSADTLTTTASNAVGFMFDTRMTNDTWWLTGVKADTDATAYNSTKVPVASTYQKFRIELDVDGNADFFIDGGLVGSVESAVTASTSLTPVLSVMSLTTTSPTLDADYIYCSMNR
jgi:hypothetical protein